MTAKKNLPKSLLILVALLLIVSSNATAKPMSRPHALDGWPHRSLITVANSGSTALTDYQVRVYLDSSNFTFADANSDGSDIRFTALDGTTLLSYWMESWTPATNGTFWVKIPSIPANGNSSIYMHYGNPAATTSASNGTATFYSFEDFESTPWTAWTKEEGPGTFIQSNDLARRGGFSGKLVTDGTTGSTVFSKASSLPGTNFVQEWDLYDDMDATAFKMVRANYQISGGQIGIGVWTGSSPTNYTRHNTDYSYTATSVARSQGWHKMAIRVASGSADYYVDDSSSLGTLTGLPATFNRVSVEGIPGGPTTYYVDDIRVRQYVSPEPTVTVGGTVTPSVDLAVVLTDSPDPVNLGGTLTYQVAVHNYGDLPATGVTITDVLPAGVTYSSATPSQGSCTGTSTITCALGGLASGGSASIAIAVTAPASPGTLTNTATVACAETEANQANNSSTATTVVGNPVVYVVNAVDTEAFNNHPTTPQHIVFDVHNFIKGQSTHIGPLMAASFRNANTDSFGMPFKMTWYMEMDDFINNGVYANGSPMSYLTLYNTFTNPANFRDDIALWGDELAYHHHFSVWTGSAWIQSGHDHATDGQYDEHNNAIDRMILDANYFPSNFRAGWLNNSNQLQAWVENWMIADFGGNGWGGTGWAPYHPSETSYTSVGDMDHWMVNCNGGDITSAFTQAANTGRPVIYCWYSHDRDNMPSMITSLQSSATAAAASTGIPFRYATSLEAIQAVIGTTDTTRPTLTITQGSGTTYNIASSETLWQDIPYVAARYITPTGRLAYRHLPAATLGTNAWSVDVPATQTITTTIPPVEYAPAGVTASHQMTGYGAALAIDGNESTYWDSTNQVNPNWISVDLGTTQPVAMATVHFYDNDGRTYTYSIDASNDGINWTEIVPSSTISGTATYSPATPVNLRYFRVNVTNNSAGTYAHIYEISLFATSTSTTLTETATLQRVGAGAVDRSGNSNVASIQGPTAVELNYFRATRASDGVLLTWETVNEATLAGFNLYRREPGREFVQVNSELIAPQAGGQPLGSAYTWLDEGIPLDRRYEYRLEAIETTLAAGSTALATFWPFDVLLPVIIH